MENRIFKTELAGRELSVETGKVAQLANASVIVRYGETVVLVTATASKTAKEGVDFFPLSVDYEEKLYAVGKIPGSYTRREGKPSEKAILTSRVIDRPIRPLFPSDMRNEVTVIATVLSVEQDNSPEIAAMIGSSVALSISDIPFNGPTGSVSLGYVDGKCVINPNVEQRAKSQMEVTLSGTKDKVIMIEAGAKEIPEDVLLDCIQQGHEEIKKIVAFIESIVAEIGMKKFEYVSATVSEDIISEVEKYVGNRIEIGIQEKDKKTRDNNIDEITNDVLEHFAEIYPDQEAGLKEAIYKLEKKTVRRLILEEHKRVDGRGIEEIRPLSAEVGLLPRVHGSGLFARGQTQVLTTVTLGSIADVQLLDGIEEEESKRYMHHYNMPPYSVGEARTSRGPGRREIGHGALAERALVPVIPDETEFPYAIRLVSEVLSSNGSTSQGSICGSTLALMDAGVPIKAPVAGISAGLVTDKNDPSRYIIITDIQGIEDFFGDMDFKIGGTKKGITAIQLDLKIDGLTFEMIKETFYRLKKAREYILDEVILKAISEPRKELSKYAPKVKTIMINPDKIREVIGTGGKVINKIIADYGVKIDINDNGQVFVAGVDIEKVDGALETIQNIARDIEAGQVLTGTVTKIMPFGAFVEIAPGKEGLVHISKLDARRVDKVEDVVNIGDKITVKVIEIDAQGKISLSRKDALSEGWEK